MTSDRYWIKRAKIETLRLVKGQRKAAHGASRLFEDASEEIGRLLEEWYQRYASDTGMTMAEAHASLSDRRAYELTLEQYHALVQRYPADHVATRLLDRYHAGSQINRLQYLQMQLNQLQTALYGRLDGLTRQECVANYEDAYYRTIYGQHQWQGLATPFARINPQAVTQALETPIRTHNFSERRWGKHRIELAERLNRIIGSGLALGTTKADMIRQLTAQMKMSESRARTLIRTEVGRMRAQATLASMRANGAPQYKFVAVLDALTSEVCRERDGMIFDVDDAKIGLNFPPLHPNCRSVAVEHWPPEAEDDDSANTRFARDSDGNAYKVPASMTYDQWYNKYVQGDPEELLRYTMQRNAAQDLVLYEKYAQAGVPVEDSLDDFQTVKYGDPTKWAERKQQYRLLEQWRAGELPITINTSKQKRHLLGEGYIEGRSYFTIGPDELQALVNKLAGTGHPKFRGTSFRETVDTGKAIGVILYLDGKPPAPTTWINIHYSKTGVHVVPAEPIVKGGQK